MKKDTTLRPLRTVLIGTSLAAGSDQVVRTGLAVARAAGTRVQLVHAASIEPRLLQAEAGFGPDFAQKQIAWREDLVREQARRLGVGDSELAGISVRPGAPYRVLTDVARAVTAGLIVVGASESGGVLLGSTAERVMQKASCPVLLARGDEPVPLRRVLAPVDLSTLAADAFRCGLRLLSRLAEDGEVKVRVVYAASFLDTLAVQHQSFGEISLEQVESYDAKELRRFVLENRAEASFDMETAVLSGEARFEILHELSEHPVDLVMLGTHGRGGLDRLVVGSVASTIARKAPCSVLLISPEAVLEEGIAEAITAQTMPAWHLEPSTARSAS